MTVLSSNEIQLEPQTALETDKPTYSLTVEGVTTITNDATLTMYVYRGSTDVTATVTTGSMSFTNGPPAIITTKKLQSLKIGTYVVTVVATMDGVEYGFQFDLYVQGKSGKK